MHIYISTLASTVVSFLNYDQKFSRFQNVKNERLVNASYFIYYVCSPPSLPTGASAFRSDGANIVKNWGGDNYF